jgi:hypothetical protein
MRINCGICQEEVRVRGWMKECARHVFCYDCIIRATIEQAVCPACRVDVSKIVARDTQDEVEAEAEEQQWYARVDWNEVQLLGANPAILLHRSRLSPNARWDPETSTLQRQDSPAFVSIYNTTFPS